MKRRAENNKKKVEILVLCSNCSQENTTLSKVLNSSDLEVKYVKNKIVKYESGIIKREKSERRKINI